MLCVWQVVRGLPERICLNDWLEVSYHVEWHLAFVIEITAAAGDIDLRTRPQPWDIVVSAKAAPWENNGIGHPPTLALTPLD